MRVFVRQDGSEVVVNGLDKAWVPEPTVAIELEEAAEEFASMYRFDRVDDIVKILPIDECEAVAVYYDLDQYSHRSAFPTLHRHQDGWLL